MVEEVLEKVSKEEMKNEAVARMRYLHLSKRCIEAFQNADSDWMGGVWQSEGEGALYTVSDKVKKMIDEFEKRTGSLVYHVIFTPMIICGKRMDMYSLIYVPSEKNDWKLERGDMKKGMVYAYVYNETVPEFSEVGTIFVKPNIGGLVQNNCGFDYEEFNDRGDSL